MLRSLTSVAIFSIAATSVEMLLSRLLSKHSLQDRDLTIDKRLLLFSLQFATWSLVANLLVSMYSWPRTRLSGSRRPWADAWARGCMFVGILIAASAYVLAWMFLVRTGVFPGIDTFWFIICNCSMLWQYFIGVEPANMRAVIMSVPVLCAATWWFNLRLSRFAKWVDLGISQFGLAAATGLIWINVLWLCGICASQSQLEAAASVMRGLPASLSPSFSFEMRFRSSPFISLATDCFLIPGTPNVGTISPGTLRSRLYVDSNIQTADDSHRMSVILITIESLRADVINLEHQGQFVLPCVTSLAAKGTFFSRCYTQSTHSDYADPAILSSLYPLRLPYAYVYERNSPWPKVLIYELLSKQGYSTAMFSSQNEAWSNMHLFYASPHLDVLFDARSKATESHFIGEMADWHKLGLQAGKLDDATTTTEAIKWIVKQQESDRPYFLSLNFQTSHFPYSRPDSSPGPFRPANVPADSSMIGWDRAYQEPIRNAYFNALRYVDEQIARVVAHLDASGSRSKTLIVVTGDHGEAFGEEGFTGHGAQPLDVTTRVGLIVNCPGRIPMRHDQSLAQSIDIAPTIVAAVGISPDPCFQGVNLFGMSAEEATQRLAFIHCRTGIVGTDCVITSNGWKYMFDHLRGAGKLTFLTGESTTESDCIGKCPEVAKILHELLMKWRSQQVLYYSDHKYFGLYYPPKPPVVDEAQRLTLLAPIRETNSEK